MKSSDPLFEETQYFRQLWLWIILIPSMLLAAILPWINASDTNPVYIRILTTIFTFFVLFWFYYFRLQTRITEEGIFYRFYPLQIKYRHIDFDEIARLEVIKYHPIRDFGGWGIKYGFRGKAYNVSGNMGLVIYYKSGKHILLGTNKAEDLKLIVERMQLPKSPLW